MLLYKALTCHQRADDDLRTADEEKVMPKVVEICPVESKLQESYEKDDL